MKTGIYLHIPFCKSRCTYCDFNTYIQMEPLYEPYVRALQTEIRCAGGEGMRSKLSSSPHLLNSLPQQAQTIFIGGGTPSLLQPQWIGDLLTTTREQFVLPHHAEITMECNPGTVTLEYLHAIRQQGVNRLSFGAQSADPQELKLLGREHSFAQVQQAIQHARTAGFDNVNFDLIFGLPYQTLASWTRTLDAALQINPDHISLYALTIEQGTPMYDWTKRGDVPFPDPDLAADMYDYAESTMGAAGFDHYEISNWCKPGHECEHNLIYWRNEPYFGLGAGAHSSSIDRRWWKVRRPADYIARAEKGDPLEANGEEIDERMSRGETMMMGLRLLNEGVSQARFAQRYGKTVSAFYPDEIKRGTDMGLLDVTSERVRLTSKGHFLSNQVMMMFV